MHPADTPLPLTARIRTARNQMRCAQLDNDPSREFHWAQMMDRLLDRHINLMKAANTFRPLYILDPELDARLSVKLDYRLIGR